MRKSTSALWFSFVLAIASGSVFAQSADLSITKTDSPDPVAAGSNVTYQIGIVNGGPATAQNVVLNDVLPIGPTFVSATFSGGSLAGTCTKPAVGETGGTFNCTYPALTNGQSSNYSIVLAVPAGSTGSISNTATVTSATTDPTPANNTATATTAINSNADLSITKTDSPDPVAAGSNVTYQIGIVNGGPATAQNVVLNDVLPIGPTFVSATFSGGSLAGTCTKPAVGETGGTFNCTYPALTNGQSSNYSIVLAVPAGSTGSISNTATVTSATTDPTPGNNSATATTAINSNADLSITKTDSPDPVAAGSNVTYQIGIVNGGPATAQNVVLNDVLPIGPTFVSATFSGGSLAGTCTKPAVGETGGTFNCTYPALTNGQSSNYSIVLAVPAGSTGSISNTATVTSATTDPTPGNNSATATTAINSNADLSITKTDSPDPVAAGSNVTYQIGIVNGGPATAQNVVLNDVLPIGPTFVSATFSGGSLAGTCTKPAVGETGGTFNCTYPALTNGQSSNYSIVLAVPAGSTGSISNTATVTSATTDPTPGNNSATATTAINSNADLSITKTDSPDPVAAGSNVTYQIGIVNGGPATAQNVVLNDVLPIGPTFVSATFSGGSLAGTCTKPAVGETGGTFNCTYPALTNGQSSNYSIVLAVPAGSTGSISNTATVTSATTDPTPGNNSATATTAINSNADLSITKTDSPDPVAAGSNVTYQIGIVNGGPATAQNVVLNDVLPIGPTFVSATFSGGSLAGTCTKPAVGETGGTFNCTYPALTNGQSSNYSIVLAVPAGSTGSISNTATVSSATNDPNLANNSVTATTDVLPSFLGASSRKSHGGTPFDIAIDPSGSMTPGQFITVEPRQIGAGFLIVFLFGSPPTSATVTTSSGSGVVAFAGNEAIVTLTGVADATRVQVDLSNVNGTSLSATARIGFLVGDVNGSRLTNSTDILTVKSASGATASAGNFKSDLNASGLINSTDVLIVKASSGHLLP